MMFGRRISDRGRIEILEQQVEWLKKELLATDRVAETTARTAARVVVGICGHCGQDRQSFGLMILERTEPYDYFRGPLTAKCSRCGAYADGPFLPVKMRERRKEVRKK